MSSMTYAQPYPMQPAPGYNQVTRRMMTDVERQFPIGVYKGVQRAARGIAVVCLILFVLNTFVISTIVTDPITLDTLSIMMSVFLGVFGLVSIGMAINTIVMRKKVSDAMAEGTVVEVVGPAYRSGVAKNAQAWTVGPVSMMASREVLGLIREGAPTSVLCVPRLKSAIAVNNVGLRIGARVMLPPNLEMMATPVGIPSPIGQPSPYQPQMAFGNPQFPLQQAAPSEEIPPPPPD